MFLAMSDAVGCLSTQEGGFKMHADDVFLATSSRSGPRSFPGYLKRRSPILEK